MRCLLFHYDTDAEKRMEAAFLELVRAAGYTNPWSFDLPEPLSELSLQLGPSDEPSEILQAHELAAELARLEARRPADRTQEPWDVFRAAVTESQGGVITALTLCAFLPTGADEVPDAHVATDAARAARVAHPEWFRRAWIEGQLATWLAAYRARNAEYAERDRLPASDPRSDKHVVRPVVPILPPLSRASVRSHELWLANEDGDALEARGVDATGAKLSTRDLSSAVLVDVTLDRADVSFTKLHGATLQRVRAREASFANAMLAGAHVEACDFEAASFAVGKLGDAVIEDTSFERASLDRSSWYRVVARRCRFTGALFTNAAFDKARFTDCDFRGVSFAVPRQILGTAWEAVFERCDLRDTDWTGQDLFRVRFIDCKLAGAHGMALMAEAVVERADLSAAGDGSQPGTLDDVQRLLQAGPYAPPPPPVPPPTHFTKTYALSDAEADVAAAAARRHGGSSSQTPIDRRGLELWFEVHVRLPLSVAETVIDDALAAHRAARLAAAAAPRPAPAVRAIPPGDPPGLRAQRIIDACADRDASFEETVAMLVTAGFTRDQALEAMIDPGSLDL